jgi:hypothetical protein
VARNCKSVVSIALTCAVVNAAAWLVLKAAMSVVSSPWIAVVVSCET